MSNSNNDLSNCRKLLALLDSCFKGAVFGDVKVDELSHSLLQVIELATPPAQPAVPLTVEQIKGMDYRGTLDEHIRSVRMTEAAHGITEKGQS